MKKLITKQKHEMLNFINKINQKIYEKPKRIIKNFNF